MIRQSYKRIEKKLAGSLQLTTDAATSARMGRIRQRGTTPELVVRSTCSALGLHYRTHNRDLPGSPDLANRSRRWAIFVHGCYWHRHQDCSKATTPKRNARFWLAKFERNVERDARAVEALKAQGFQVLVVWQCETEAGAQLIHRVERFARQLRMDAE